MRKQLLAVNYFSKITSSQMFYWVINTPLEIKGGIEMGPDKFELDKATKILFSFLFYFSFSLNKLS